jgi:Flp pilus assembly protein TadG
MPLYPIHSPTSRLHCSLHRFLMDHRGSNAVEFALVAPVLFLMFVGLFYSGMYIGIAHTLSQLAADASRYATVGIDAGERQLLANRWIGDQTRAYGLVDRNRLKVITAEANGALQVTLDYDMTYLPRLPIIGAVVAFPESMERSSTVLVQ